MSQRKQSHNFLILLVIVALTTIIFLIIPTFRNRPLIPINSSPTSFIVFGDSGWGDAKQKELAQTMLTVPFSFMLHTGDVAYPDGTTEQLQDTFFSVYKAHLERGPMYPSPGNHDYITANLAPYLTAFNLPEQTLRIEDAERYYSFDKNNVHFVALDTNTPLYAVSDTAIDDMADWLVQDLRQSDAQWKIVYFHHSPYSSGKQHGSDLRVRNIVVPIFEQYGVDLVFSGHEHNYERTCVLQNDICSTDGIVYVVTGGGGGPIYEFGDAKDFTASRSAVYHFVQATASACRIAVQAIGINGTAIDTFSLEKCR